VCTEGTRIGNVMWAKLVGPPARCSLNGPGNQHHLRNTRTSSSGDAFDLPPCRRLSSWRISDQWIRLNIFYRGGSSCTSCSSVPIGKFSWKDQLVPLLVSFSPTSLPVYLSVSSLSLSSSSLSVLRASTPLSLCLCVWVSLSSSCVQRSQGVFAT